jgi:hypothetical protein
MTQITAADPEAEIVNRLAHLSIESVERRAARGCPLSTPTPAVRVAVAARTEGSGHC